MSSLRQCLFGDVSRKTYTDAATVRSVQSALTDLANAQDDDPGVTTMAWLLDPKGIDGILGPNTKAAIQEYQAEQQHTVDGQIDDWLLKSLGINAPRSSSSSSSSSRVDDPGFPMSSGSSSSSSKSKSGPGGAIVAGLAVGGILALATRKKKPAAA